MSKKVAWITGGSSGIGAATAQKLAKQGWTVAITGTTKGKLDIVCDKDPQFIKGYACDVTKPKKVAEIIDQIEHDLGPIDMAILNAGTYDGENVDEFTAARFKKHFDVNVLGVGNCLEPLLTKFLNRRYGHIAITSSVAGYRGLPRSLSYSATKAALINLAESLAIELYKSNIKVQVICPGFVKTPLTDQNDFEMPMLMEVDDAAEKLVEGLKSYRFEINFPWTFALMLKTLKLLPAKLYFMLAYKIKEKRMKADSKKHSENKTPDEDKKEKAA